MILPHLSLSFSLYLIFIYGFRTNDDSGVCSLAHGYSFAQTYKWHAKDISTMRVSEKSEEEENGRWQCQNEWGAKKNVFKARICVLGTRE